VKISRNPSEVAAKEHDLVIVGGGIYGAMICLEAASRGIKSLLLERDDFGAATSFNSLKTIHGGLRYLQRLNLGLYFRFVRERRWFLEAFPELVKPMAVLMPLYGKGGRRPIVFRMGLTLDALLSLRRNEGLAESSQLPFGSYLDVGQVRKFFPPVDKTDLKGGVIWYDASMPDSQKIILKILLLACNYDGRVLNYMNARDIVTIGNNVTGIIATDTLSGETYQFQTKRVINAAGPWVRQMATRFDKDYPQLFKQSLAWNILFDRKAFSPYALAITPRPFGQTYFVHPWKDRLLIGTGHAGRDDKFANPQPTPEEISMFIDDISTAVPGLNLQPHEIVYIYSGFLPVYQENGTKLTQKEVIVDHVRHQGPKGLYSVSGVKFTAARYVAEKLVNYVFPANTQSGTSKVRFDTPELSSDDRSGIFDYGWFPEKNDTTWQNVLSNMIKNQSVQHLDDLILRRTSLGDNPERAIKLAPQICQLFSWDDKRCKMEIRRLKMHYKVHGNERYSSLATENVSKDAQEETKIKSV
jgi:glycerol-3-phosphate dehydrogenase